MSEHPIVERSKEAIVKGNGFIVQFQIVSYFTGRDAISD